MGITAMASVGQLKAGPHLLTLGSRVDSGYRNQVIPFWKTK